VWRKAWRFPQKTEIFIRCGRLCCLCLKQCGTNTEAAHIIDEAKGGPDDADNGIPVCFDCHQEIGAYNDLHPKGKQVSSGRTRGTAGSRVRWAARSKSVSVPFFQLPWVMGTKAMEEALERVKQWTLANVFAPLIAVLCNPARGKRSGNSPRRRSKSFRGCGFGCEISPLLKTVPSMCRPTNLTRQLIADGFAQHPAKVQLRILRTARLSRVVSGYNPCVASEMFKGARQEMCEAAKTRRR